QLLLQPDHVPVTSELAAILGEQSNLAKAEAPMQRHRGLIRLRDSSEDPVDVLVTNRFKQRGVELRADTASHRLRRAVDRRLDRRFIRCLGTKRRRAGIAGDEPITFRHQQAMPYADSEYREPRSPFFDGVGFDVESN